MPKAKRESEPDTTGGRGKIISYFVRLPSPKYGLNSYIFCVAGIGTAATVISSAALANKGR